MTTTAAAKLLPYYVNNALVMAHSEADAIRKIYGVAVDNLTNYPEVNPEMTVEKLKFATTATLKD